MRRIEGNMKTNKQYESRKIAIIGKIDKYKKWYNNEIEITRNLAKLDANIKHMNLEVAIIAELKNIILNPDIKSKYEQFKAFLSQFEKYKVVPKLSAAAMSNIKRNISSGRVASSRDSTRIESMTNRNNFKIAKNYHESLKDTCKLNRRPSTGYLKKGNIIYNHN